MFVNFAYIFWKRWKWLFFYFFVHFKNKIKKIFLKIQLLSVVENEQIKQPLSFKKWEYKVQNILSIFRKKILHQKIRQKMQTLKNKERISQQRVSSLTWGAFKTLTHDCEYRVPCFSKPISSWITLFGDLVNGDLPSSKHVLTRCLSPENLPQNDQSSLNQL